MCSHSCTGRRAVGREHSPEELLCWSCGCWMRIFPASLHAACLSGSWWSTDRRRWGQRAMSVYSEGCLGWWCSKWSWSLQTVKYYYYYYYKLLLFICYYSIFFLFELASIFLSFLFSFMHFCYFIISFIFFLFINLFVLHVSVYLFIFLAFYTSCILSAFIMFL